MADQALNTVNRAIGMASLGFGAFAAAAPSAFRQVYGDTTDASGSLDYFGRTWGTRTATLGALILMASSDAERKRIATLSAAMNAVDFLAAFGARDVPTGTRRLAALTSASFAVASGYVAAAH
jgi:hypothetical protein